MNEGKKYTNTKHAQANIFCWVCARSSPSVNKSAGGGCQ